MSDRKYVREAAVVVALGREAVVAQDRKAVVALDCEGYSY